MPTSELEREPFVPAVLAAQFIDLIRESGASFEEANSALKAAHALLQCLPLRISAHSRADELDEEAL